MSEDEEVGVPAKVKTISWLRQHVYLNLRIFSFMTSLKAMRPSSSLTISASSLFRVDLDSSRVTTRVSQRFISSPMSRYLTRDQIV